MLAINSKRNATNENDLLCIYFFLKKKLKIKDKKETSAKIFYPLFNENFSTAVPTAAPHKKNYVPAVPLGATFGFCILVGPSGGGGGRGVTVVFAKFLPVKFFAVISNITSRSR